MSHDAAPVAGRGRALARADSRVMLAAAGLAAAGVVAQISFPLTSGPAAVLVTVLSVLLLAAAALVHSGAVTGSLRPPAAVLVAAGGAGWLAEAIGVHTGLPFGQYRYSDLLGPQLLSVPLLVPLAWTMLGYPCLLLGRRLSLPRPGLPAAGSASPRRLRTALLGGLALASWDLFLDPQLVALGGWHWRFPEPSLPGVPGVPLTNYAGWVLVSIVIVGVLDRALDASESGVSRAGAVTGRSGTLAVPGSTRLRAATSTQEWVPAGVLAWTWLGSALGNLVFFGRPAVALYGVLAMGAFVAPYLRRVRQDPG